MTEREGVGTGARPPGRLGRVRSQGPFAGALLATFVILGGLLVGHEPVGGDPDRLYRPLKLELKQALDAGRLPWWSDRFGLGIPLVAESHVAAFYPPNLLFYRVFSVSTAYRLAMLWHHLALAASTYWLCRVLGATAWGSALGAISFTFCGFMTIHSSHEPFYQLMPYLPLALGLAERVLATSGLGWAGLLALALGVQWTLGHFQLQAWTNGLVLVVALWRVLLWRRPWRAASLVILAVGLGLGLAAVQLVPSGLLARQVGQTKRPTNDLLFFSYPPGHWFELAYPVATRNVQGGFEGAYWTREETTAYEAGFYAGTLPLIFAIVALSRACKARPTRVYLLAGLAAFGLAILPRVWQAGYIQLIALPGFGYFRAPARYTLISSLALALGAAEGFDCAIEPRVIKRALAGALVLAIAAGWGVLVARIPHARPPWIPPIPDAIAIGALVWLAALGIVWLWSRRSAPAWLVVAATALELGVLFHTGTTVWGWRVNLPGSSPVLGALESRGAARVGGEIENFPLWAQAGTAFPYLGFTLPPPSDFIERIQQPLFWEDPRTGAGLDAAATKRWLKRAGVTHLAGRPSTLAQLGQTIWQGRDPALDRVARRRLTDPPERVWSVVALEPPFPEARVALRAREAPDPLRLLERLSTHDDLDIAWSVAGQGVPRPDAATARLINWDGARATVEHQGACDLVIARTFDPGWQARIDAGAWGPVAAVDGGVIGVRLEGSGHREISLRYTPPGFAIARAVSAAALAVIAAALGYASQARLRAPSSPARS